MEADGLLRVALRPDLYELIGREVALPGLNAADLHELAPLVLPGHLGVGHLGVELVDWALVGSRDQEHVLVIQIDIVPYTLALAFDRVFEVQLGGVHHHFGGVLVELQELLHQLRVHQVIPDNNLPEEILEPCAAGIQILLGHLEEEALLGEGGEGVVGVFEAVEELIELGEALLDVPLVVPGFELDVEEDSARFGLALREGGH